MTGLPYKNDLCNQLQSEFPSTPKKAYSFGQTFSASKTPSDYWGGRGRKGKSIPFIFLVTLVVSSVATDINGDNGSGVGSDKAKDGRKCLELVMRA